MNSKFWKKKTICIYLLELMKTISVQMRYLGSFEKRILGKGLLGILRTMIGDRSRCTTWSTRVPCQPRGQMSPFKANTPPTRPLYTRALRKRNKRHMGYWRWVLVTCQIRTSLDLSNSHIYKWGNYVILSKIGNAPNDLEHLMVKTALYMLSKKKNKLQILVKTSRFRDASLSKIGNAPNAFQLTLHISLSKVPSKH